MHTTAPLKGRFTALYKMRGVQQTKTQLTKEGVETLAKDVLTKGVAVVIAYTSDGVQLEYTLNQKQQIACHHL